MIFSMKVKKHRFMVRLVIRKEIIEGLDSEMAGNSPYGHGRTHLLALV